MSAAPTFSSVQHKLTGYQGFEKWAEVTGSSSAQLLDLFPILQRLPKFLLPNYRYAEELHKAEKALYVGHWLNAKKAIKNGTGKVRKELYSPTLKDPG
jgi:hypothetical protein